MFGAVTLPAVVTKSRQLRGAGTAVRNMPLALLFGGIAECIERVIYHFAALCSDGTVPKAMAIAC